MSALLTLPTALLIVFILAAVGFVLGRKRAISAAGGDQSSLHSLPKQHGWHVALATAAPAFVLIIFWSFFSGLVSNIYVEAIVPDDQPELRLPLDQREGLSDREIEIRIEGRRDLFIANVKSLAVAIDGYIANGNATEAEVGNWRADLAPLQERLRADGQVVGASVTQGALTHALSLRSFNRGLAVTGPALAIALSVIGFALSLALIKRDFRARIAVEGWARGFLVFASTMAILTTVAILYALTAPSLTFFREYGVFNFLFGLEWAPAGDVAGVPEGHDGEYESALGFLPLIWGTLYIALVALLVSVPLGLFAAIYLSEFASKRVRAWVKPALEILAGVPTIVYGIFALVTIGPFLQAVVGSTVMPNTVSVVTAGTVMGMMLVPFVSSLSDDVINAVPQAMRDGSLGLGATPSETVLQVILPAALPGIVGAIVLAASRAIGETMIVVLAAGALSNVTGLEPNPFGAVVTVTTRIVAVLTGEGSGFDSIDVLAVFALAFTLFFITLGLNLLAQRMVAKYREQYD
ncbi:phosphate ABC transporter permease subunit PstC [Maritalea mobilis]|uniref:phosphate ABC transporter permease subunit PstC n=1 Tax=Maritalea mobilis TaxID=483324 RepID=UPI001C95BB67|nr:phosphate ABC transporter permease subunit PstC [Maritalea mobilis]MBY6200293.1 phosphate ABC transporter permease subunit PstC [Maritalea mobilis]